MFIPNPMSLKACKPNPIPKLHFLKDVPANIEIFHKTSIRNIICFVTKWCPNEYQNEIIFRALFWHLFFDLVWTPRPTFCRMSHAISLFPRSLFFNLQWKLNGKWGPKRSETVKEKTKEFWIEFQSFFDAVLGLRGVLGPCIRWLHPRYPPRSSLRSDNEYNYFRLLKALFPSPGAV